MLCDDEVLVLVHEQQGAVGDLASIVIHREAMRRPLGCLKPWLLSQPGAHSVRQVLHHRLTLNEIASWEFLVQHAKLLGQPGAHSIEPDPADRKKQNKSLRFSAIMTGAS